MYSAKLALSRVKDFAYVTILLLFIGSIRLWKASSRDAIEIIHDNHVASSNNSTTAPSSANSPGRLVISLTTFASRINYIYPTLESLIFNQTIKADEVFLTISGETSLPEFVSNWTQRGMLTVLHAEIDYGSIEKLLHVLIHESQSTALRLHLARETPTVKGNTRIIYLDDDVIYPPRLVESLVKASNKYPERAVAFSGCKLRSFGVQASFAFPSNCNSDINKNRHPNLYFWLGGFDSHRDRIVDIVQGFTGVLIKIKFFNVSEFVDFVTDKELPSYARKSDDIVISGYLDSRNVKKVVIPLQGNWSAGKNSPKLNTIASSTDALSSQGMHQNAMMTTLYMQRHFRIWQNFTFYNVSQFSE
eukprot:CAMPEP_0171387390 /NCGR_PEP_ID=MMETSP0879-20121228/39975_1 /TAXON_ID=67004 /ORGANISM="Thalassiosira weissflogii, Strain CCMP1336" /LENGTH=360 /DNA_ID=CAMNT_0011899715 /DNA_START=214 /DNA_END=1294 /DNA_ORIENTATION=+